MTSFFKWKIGAVLCLYFVFPLPLLLVSMSGQPSLHSPSRSHAAIAHEEHKVKSRRFPWFQQVQADSNVCVNGNEIVWLNNRLRYFGIPCVRLDSAWSCWYPTSFMDRSTTVVVRLRFLQTFEWWCRLSPSLLRRERSRTAECLMCSIPSGHW